MIKKLVKGIKVLLIGAIWTIVFLFAARYLLLRLWMFDIFYKKQWAVMSGYWNNNGVIMQSWDYMFFLTLIVLFAVWLWGWRFFYKLDYLKALMRPFEYISNYQLKKYEAEDRHVVIKNISIGEKLTIEDVIQDRISNESHVPVKGADQLRHNIAEKIIKRKE